MKTYFFFLFILLNSYNLFAQKLPAFKAEDQPSAPDYSNANHWLSLPFRIDGADVIPKNETWISDSLKHVDVFYIYPTLYSKGKTWCADITDKKLNKRLDKYPVKYQASLFNAVGRVYTPLYRQGIVQCFKEASVNAEMALDFAYADVKQAFEYYMQHYNQNRPIIIVSHSQGTRHARQLLKDFFDTPEMKNKLVCAYIVGFGVYQEKYELLSPCADSSATNCYVTWASFKQNYNASVDTMFYGNVCVNPISWNSDTAKAAANSGILLNINRKRRYTTVCNIYDNYLWVKTNMPIARRKENLHLLDFNLFWHEIKKNAAERVAVYLKGSN
jgi:hypothetical protein